MSLSNAQYMELLQLLAQFQQQVEALYPLYAQAKGRGTRIYGIIFDPGEPDFIGIRKGADVIGDDIVERFPATYLFDENAASDLRAEGDRMRQKVSARMRRRRDIMHHDRHSSIVNVEEVKPLDFLDGMEKSGCFPKLAKALRASRKNRTCFILRWVHALRRCLGNN